MAFGSRVVGTLAILLGCVASTSTATEPSRRPNLVLLIADDLGYGEPGCYGGELPTPHIDALASSGVRFTAGYVTAPFCAASRAGLLTGRYQTRFGFEFNPIGAVNADPAVGLPVKQKTLADRLRDAGYATGLVGKWHLGGTAKFHPQRRGFDEFFGFLHEGHYYVPQPWSDVTTWLRRKRLPDGSQGRWTSPDGRVLWSTHMGHNEPDYDADNPLLRSSQPVDEQSYLTEAFTREAVRFIDRHRAQPFFLCVAYNAVHSPMQATDADLKRFASIADPQRRIFAAMLASLDDSVGAILKSLHDAGLDRDTIVVFLSDNGGPTRELTSSNRPLRGEKGSLYEGGLRVPFLMRWPGGLPAGRVEDRAVISLDVFATMSIAAGVATSPSEDALDGVNLRPYLNGQNAADPHDALFWRVGPKGALRQGPWKLHRPGPQRPGENRWELYHLVDDVGEARNLSERHPDRVRAMEETYERFNSEMVEPLWR
ncbi:MAG: sulfatase-like hydrolase/transferase [Planctomycetaceae bacterium]|nr:sulfatase-like hydrolase/transferase [Planctomycetaceae bacterium]